MRVQLIHPPIYINLRSIQALRPSLPLGLAYIAAALREAGHEVSVLDAVMREPDRLTPDGPLHYVGLRPEEIAEAIDPEADVIGVGVLFSFAWPLVKRIIQAIKERRPDAILIGGGEHFTGMPEHSLRSAPLDYLVLGEGEATVTELVAALEGGDPHTEAIPGLAFLRNGEFVQSPRRERIRDLDALPLPAWDLFDVRGYYGHGYVMGFDSGMTMPILATRGCPYKCTFCSAPLMWQRRWYAREPVRVVDEIDHYRRAYGATNFPFHDLTAALRKEWVVAFCEELLRRDLRITWQLTIGTRSEAIDDDVAGLLRRTGCTALSLAPETGSERVRALLGKKTEETAILRAARTCARHGLNVCNFYVVGFPQDTWADLRQSVRLAVKLALAGTNDIALNNFFPIPGTQLYDELVDKGRIIPSDEFLLTPLFAMEATIRDTYNYCEALSAWALTRMKYRILLAFYATSFLTRPCRLFHLIWHVLREEETCKLDTFLINRKRRIFKRIHAGYRRRARPSRVETP